MQKMNEYTFNYYLVFGKIKGDAKQMTIIAESREAARRQLVSRWRNIWGDLDVGFTIEFLPEV